MTKRECIKLFREEIVPRVKVNDWPSLNESFANWVDSLHRDGKLTDTQAQTIVHGFKKWPRR